MYLFFDTETTWLPKDWHAPVSDTANWPRVVQIAWREYGANGEPGRGEVHLVRPEGFSIPADATRIHGITTSRALREGIPLEEALHRFNKALLRSTVLVAHNIEYDEKIVGAEFLRKNITTPMLQKICICTMKASTEHCNIPGPYGLKWPSLSELHFTLFHDVFAETHNAEVDVAVCAKCFFQLVKLGVILIPPRIKNP